MSPARCRSPILVFRYTPNPTSAPSDLNCHLGQREGWGHPPLCVCVSPSPWHGAPSSPEDAAGEEDLVLDLVGRAAVDHHRVLVLLRQLVPHIVVLGHIPPVVDLEGDGDGRGYGIGWGTPPLRNPRGLLLPCSGTWGSHRGPSGCPRTPPGSAQGQCTSAGPPSSWLVGWRTAGFGGAVTHAGSPSPGTDPPSLGVSSNKSREGDVAPRFQLGTPRGGGQDSHPRTTTFLRVSSLRKCLTRL